MSNNTLILMVDDEPNILQGMRRNLRGQFNLNFASSAEEGLSLIEAGNNYAVIVSDYNMPGMNGSQFLAQCAKRLPNAVRVMLTGQSDMGTALAAINEGAIFRFLNKPCTPDHLGQTLNIALRQHELLMVEKQLLEETLLGTITVLSNILRLLDPVVFSRTQLRQNAVERLAKSMRATDVWEIMTASLLADIGLATVPSDLVERDNFHEPVTPQEESLLRHTSEFGCKLICDIPKMGNVAQIILYQNKNYDGSGVPQSDVKERGIPLGARILRVVNQMTRRLQSGDSLNQALENLRENPGYFDPLVIECARQKSMEEVWQALSPEYPGPYVRSTPIADLRPGDILRSPVSTKDGQTIVAARQTLSEVHIQKIRHHAQTLGIQEPLELAAETNLNPILVEQT